MLGKFFECEADRYGKYYRVIHTLTKYSDGKSFPINKIVIADKKTNLNAIEQTEMGGFCVSTYNYIFRWLIRGDTICEVKIPEDTKIYKTVSENGVYIADKIILTNPHKINDDLAMKLYKASTLPEKSYFIAMTVCAICGYMNTAMEVLKEKVNKNNVEAAISELKMFCKERKKEKYPINQQENENVIKILDKLNEIKNM